MFYIHVEKTVYDKPSSKDGKRILVMRLWPRGVRKAAVDLWLKDVGTDRELIKDWKAGRVTRSEFEKRYLKMMIGEEQRRLVKEIGGYAREGRLPFSAHARIPRCAIRTF